MRSIPVLLPAAALLAGAPSALAVPLEVQSATSIEVETRAVGRRVDVVGFVRDDLGVGQPARTVVIVARSRAHAEVRREVLTQADGAWMAPLRLDEGDWMLEASFAGAPGQQPSVARRLVTVALRTPRIEADWPAAWRQGDDVSVDLRVTAGGAPLSQVPVTVSGSCARKPGPALTDASGVLRVALVEEPRGACALSVEVPASDASFAASWSATGFVVADAALRLSVAAPPSPFALVPTWRLEACALVGDDSVAGVAVYFEGSGHHEPRVTSAGGCVEESIAAPGLGGAFATTVSAASFRPATLDLPARRGLLPWLGLALAIGAILALVLEPLSRRLALRRGRASGRPGRPGGPGVRDPSAPLLEPVPGLEAGRALLQVVDRDSRRPIEASVQLAEGHVSRVPAEGLAFEPAGAAPLRVESPGWLPARLAAPPPGYRLVVPLASVRAEVAVSLSALAPQGDADAPRWGRATVSEIIGWFRDRRPTLRRPARPGEYLRPDLDRALHGDAEPRHPIEAAEALAALVDDVAFSGRTYGPDAVSRARTLAERATGAATRDPGVRR
jgi:hypothetical protein